jgi:hypothetical protein
MDEQDVHAREPTPSGKGPKLEGVKHKTKCVCEKPILRERSEWKGSSEAYCERCKRPLGLRLAAVRPAA